jgi:hypothetical protein
VGFKVILVSEMLAVVSFPCPGACPEVADCPKCPKRIEIQCPRSTFFAIYKIKILNRKKKMVISPTDLK